MAGPLPQRVYPLISRIVGEQEMVVEAALTRDTELAFNAFANDPLVTIGLEDAKKLYREMLENTKAYLTDYNI
jgi:alpha-galactosidase